MTNHLYFTSADETTHGKAFDAILEEQKSIGYYALPDQDIDPILRYCDSIPNTIETIAVIGIGGSSLGAKAIYEFLKPVHALRRKLYFFESTDPINITDLLSKIDLHKTHFLVISRSGSTVETFSIYKYIYSLQNDPSAYTFITDQGSPLEKYADEINAAVLYLPKNVGGRFSVLSTVGLLPLALCGVNIEALLNGAKSTKESFFNDGYLKGTLLKKAPVTISTVFSLTQKHSSIFANGMYSFGVKAWENISATVHFMSVLRQLVSSVLRINTHFCNLSWKVPGINRSLSLK